jgi:ABC-type phosphate/phosphonate transport system substrate-binding protein
LDKAPKEFIHAVNARFAAAELLALLAAGLIVALPLAWAHAAGKSTPLQMGLANTFFTDRPKSYVDIASDEFKDVMKKTTGLTGDFIPKYGPLQVAEKLEKKQLDLGVFHAFEFAWVQKKYPELHPLLIAANKNHVERAYLIVHKNIPAKTLADLRGKKVDVPVDAKEHCRLFLEKRCTETAQKGPGAFFCSIEKSASQVAALDDVGLDKVQATVVDTVGLEFYKEIKGPVFAKNLKVLEQSAPFPPAVIVYKQGTLAEATLKQFRDGLLKAHMSELGRDMMKTWNIDAFEPVPKDYAKSLAEVLKAYPPPAPLR